MSEAPKQTRTLPTPEQIQDEDLFLLDRQAEHAQAMDELGITQKAKDKLSDFDAAKLTDLSRPTVSLRRKQEEDGGVTERVEIRFSTPGMKSTGFVYAPVAEVTGDAMSIEPEFTLPEAEAVISMAAGLKEAQTLGVLPHLSADLASINNPLTAMTLGPPQPQPPQIS